MEVSLRHIQGLWDDGWVLDKHSLSSVCIGYYANGRPQFDTKRTEVGEATFRLKNRNDWTQVQPLASALAEYIYPKLHNVDFIVPMPPTTKRSRQPVQEVAIQLGILVDKPVFNEFLLKTATGKPLKDLTTKNEKLAVLGESIHINGDIAGEGQWNVLVIDDLYHTGASLETACRVLRGNCKVGKIYVAALTWRA